MQQYSIKIIKCIICSCDFESKRSFAKFCNSCFIKHRRKRDRAGKKRWREDNKEQCKILDRKKYLARNYGITEADWDRLFRSQRGKCKICGTHQSTLARRLHVDHDHETGKVRGLLCVNCNQGLGSFHDDCDLLEKAKQYLGTV